MRPIKKVYNVEEAFVLVILVSVSIFTVIPIIPKAICDTLRIKGLFFVGIWMGMLSVEAALIAAVVIYGADRMLARRIQRKTVRKRRFYVGGTVLARSVVAQVEGYSCYGFGSVSTVDDRFTITIRVNDTDDIVSFTGLDYYEQSTGIVEGQKIAIGVEEWYDKHGDVIWREHWPKFRTEPSS